MESREQKQFLSLLKLHVFDVTNRYDLCLWMLHGSVWHRNVIVGRKAMITAEEREAAFRMRAPGTCQERIARNPKACPARLENFVLPLLNICSLMYAATAIAAEAASGIREYTQGTAKPGKHVNIRYT